MFRKRVFLILLASCGLAVSLSAKKAEASVAVPQSQIDACRAWVDRQFAVGGPLPFSFVYDGKSSGEFLSGCKLKVKTGSADAARKREVRTYTDPASGLEVRCEIVRYADYPAVEWVVYFKNNGRTKTGILENLLPLDVPFGLDGKDDVYLNYNEGGHSGAKDFQPNRMKLGRQEAKEVGAFWYGFDGREPAVLQCGVERRNPGRDDRRRLAWQWKASFDRKADTTLNVRIGQIKTRLYLEPGEEIRTPLVVVMFWNGTRDAAQNMWRGWMYDHNLPRPGGRLPEPILEAASSAYFAEMFHATDKDQMEFIDRYLEEGVKLDYWWMDAGWYPNRGGSWQDLLGTWYPDPKRYPNGLRAISDHAHAKGVRSLLWFEPERVTAGSWIYENHPEWTLGDGTTRFFNYGNPEALAWMTDHVDSLLKSEDIDLYRQDFAVMSSDYWNEEDRKIPTGRDRRNQARNRLPEIYGRAATPPSGDADRHLRRRRQAARTRKPAARRTAVAQRLRVRTGRRAGTDLRTFGLIPFSGAGVNRITAYDFRSNMSPSIVLNLDSRVKDADYPLLRRLLAQWEEVRGDYRGDFYPLTAYSLQDDVWIGWMLFRPETGTGFVQMFNRAGSIYDSGVCRLKGLDPQKRYRVTEMDTQHSVLFGGEELLGQGLRFTFTQAPESKLIRISESTGRMRRPEGALPKTKTEKIPPRRAESFYSGPRTGCRRLLRSQGFRRSAPFRRRGFSERCRLGKISGPDGMHGILFTFA
ncbi:MAG: alpha-galactosidase [Alistipes sp.]